MKDDSKGGQRRPRPLSRHVKDAIPFFARGGTAYLITITAEGEQIVELTIPVMDQRAVDRLRAMCVALRATYVAVVFRGRLRDAEGRACDVVIGVVWPPKNQFIASLDGGQRVRCKRLQGGVVSLLEHALESVPSLRPKRRAVTKFVRAMPKEQDVKSASRCDA